MTDPVTSELLRLRDSIDNMDAALVHLLAERFKITQQVGVLKAAHGLPPGRLPGCGAWRRTQNSTPSSRRSS